MQPILFTFFIAGLVLSLVGVGLASLGAISNTMIAVSSTGFGVAVFTGYAMWNKKS